MCKEEICIRDNEYPVTTLELPNTNIQIQIHQNGGKPFAGYIIDKRNGEHLHFPANDVMILLGWMGVKNGT